MKAPLPLGIGLAQHQPRGLPAHAAAERDSHSLHAARTERHRINTALFSAQAMPVLPDPCNGSLCIQLYRLFQLLVIAFCFCCVIAPGRGVVLPVGACMVRVWTRRCHTPSGSAPQLTGSTLRWRRSRRCMTARKPASDANERPRSHVRYCEGLLACTSAVYRLSDPSRQNQ